MAPTLQDSIFDTTFVILDVETTGISPAHGHRIIDISMIRWHKEAIVGDFGTLVNPSRGIPAGATAVNGIMSADLVGAPTFGVIAGDVRDFVNDAVIVAHNVTFDLGFLNTEFALAGHEQWDGIAICTLALARKLHRVKHNNLASVANRMGVPLEGEHTALGDTITTLGVFNKMLSQLAESGFTNLGQLVGAQGGMKRAPKVRLQHRAVIAQGL